jgi:hypothetical protein
VHLKAADRKVVESALQVAWKSKAPKRLAARSVSG